MTQVLNSTDAIPQLTSPEGVVYGTFQIEGHPLLWEVRPTSEDELNKRKPDYRRTQPVAGMFIGQPAAETALVKWLKLRWAASDAQAEKLAKKSDANKASRTKAATEQNEEAA